MKIIKKAFLLSVVLLVVLGIGYPLLMTGISQLLFPSQANGSMVEVDGKKVGSELIGQSFSDEKYFKGRPSAVNYNTYLEEDKIEDKDGNVAYAGVLSGSQNLAVSNPALVERVENDINKFLELNPTIDIEDIPMDLVTSSGSGLDPNISPQAAKIQIPAIAKATGITEEKLTEIVSNCTDDRQLGVLGESRVNVLMANLEIYKILNN